MNVTLIARYPLVVVDASVDERRRKVDLFQLSKKVLPDHNQEQPHLSNVVLNGVLGSPHGRRWPSFAMNAVIRHATVNL